MHDKRGRLSNVFIFRLLKCDRPNNRKRRESQDEGVKGVLTYIWPNTTRPSKPTTTTTPINAVRARPADKARRTE